MKKIYLIIKIFILDFYVIVKALFNKSQRNNLKRLMKVLRSQHMLLSLQEIYHPILIPELSYLASKRACSDRLGLIIKDMSDYSASVNDIGCQIGFFSLSLAQKGCSVIGYDMSKKNIKICQQFKELLGIQSQLAFHNLELTVDTADKIIVADYTLCLAVFHHVIYFQGLEVAYKLVKMLKAKTRRKMYFEIGQSNENIEPWCRALPNMGEDPYEWIVGFLKEGGFTNVYSLGKVPTHLGGVKRYLVAAE